MSEMPTMLEGVEKRKGLVLELPLEIGMQIPVFDVKHSATSIKDAGSWLQMTKG